MIKLSQIVGPSLLALVGSWRASAEMPRSIKAGVLNDVSGP